MSNAVTCPRLPIARRILLIILFVLPYLLLFRVYSDGISSILPASHNNIDSANNIYQKSKTEENSSSSFDLLTTPDRSPRIFCWVMTFPANHKAKAIHVKETWLRRCDNYLFMSSEDDPFLPSINLNVSEGRKQLWEKTKKAFVHLYDNHLEDYDWFLKADDDTYVILENLRAMLNVHSPEKPLYFGMHFNKFLKQGYMSGGAGYVISREALRRFGAMNTENNRSGCALGRHGVEDVAMGECMEKLGVPAGDSRDARGMHRMLPLSIGAHLSENLPNWLFEYTLYPIKGRCCSDRPISFHYMNSEMMHLMEYLLYTAGVEGEQHQRLAYTSPAPDAGK